MKILIVDENDKVIGSKEREDVTKSDIYRVSSLWIMNGKGESLFAQRAFTKDKDPGEWGPAVSGTVEEGEDYYENVVKEADEELGLKDIQPVEVFKEKFISNGWRFFNKFYFLKYDCRVENFDIDKNEVAKVRWYTKETYLKELKWVVNRFFGGEDKAEWLWEKMEEQL